MSREVCTGGEEAHAAHMEANDECPWDHFTEPDPGPEGFPTDTPPVTLTGVDGNAYALLGACQAAQRKAHWTQPQREAWQRKAQESDSYDALLQFMLRTMEVS